MQIHHVGYIVQDVKDTSVVQGNLHQVSAAYDPIQEAHICLYINQQNELIELIQPLNEKSPVWNFLQKFGNKLHHHCYTGSITDINNYIKENQLIKIMGPVPAPIFPEQKVEFYIDKNSNITEFIF